MQLSFNPTTLFCEKFLAKSTNYFKTFFFVVPLNFFQGTWGLVELLLSYNIETRVQTKAKHPQFMGFCTPDQGLRVLPQ